MKGKAFILVVLMAATLLLLGEYKQIMNYFTKKSTTITLICPIMEHDSVLEQQYSTPMVPMCAIAHISSTVGTATFNSNKKFCKTHFHIILPFPSNLCISDTYNYLQHVKCKNYYILVRTKVWRCTQEPNIRGEFCL